MRKPYILSIATTAAVLMAVLFLTPATADGQAAANITARARGGPFPWQLTVYDRQGKVVRMVGELC